MSDMVAIWHPDHPGVTSRVSRPAYERRSAGLGWRLVEEPAPQPVPEPDEKTRLTAQLEAGGVQVDGRWGIKRLRTEAAALEDLD